MKVERRDVKHPLWRKKVDSSLFRYQLTPIPNWAKEMWGIPLRFSSINSKRNPKSRVAIYFQGIEYTGHVTVNLPRRKNPEYRLWISVELQNILKRTFLMSFMRDVEYRLCGGKDSDIEIEYDIPFWEFLDIEYDNSSGAFYFNAYYKQKPSFPELFQRLVQSPEIEIIDDELQGKPSYTIHAQKWIPRKELDTEMPTNNVLYTLIDTKKRLIYVGEAEKLVDRLKINHRSIKDWNFFRYERLPNEITSKQRKALEKMLIRFVAYLFPNKRSINSMNVSGYLLANDRIV